jgi:hypothetical protein
MPGTVAVEADRHGELDRRLDGQPRVVLRAAEFLEGRIVEADTDSKLRAALIDMSYHLGADPEAVRAMLSMLERKGREAGGWRMLLLGLHLASEIVSLDLPPAVREGIARSGTVRRLGKVVLRRLYEGDVSQVGRFRTLCFRLSARERMRDRVRYLVLLFLSPSYSDWKSIRLPARLAGLYYLIRPFRLLVKLVGSAGNRMRRQGKGA